MRLSIILICFAVTAFAVNHVGSVQPVPIKQPLEQFPRTIDGWHAVRDISSSDEVVRMLGVTDYIQRDYINSDGIRVNFYVGYYHAVGVDGAYHSPQNCLPGGGWGIASVKDIKLSLPDNRTEYVAEMIIQNDDARQVVLYWYQNRGRIIASEYWEKIYLVLDALFKHRRDGAFVRIMAYANNGDVRASEKVLKAFAEHALVVLESYLPGSTI